MNQNQKEYAILHEKNMYKSFIIMALPVMAANLLKSMNDIVDTFFIGQMQNSVASQAGVAIDWPLLNIFMSLSIGFAVAGVAVISREIGAGKYEEARKYAGMLLELSIIIGIAINIFLYVLSPGVLTLMGAKAEVFDAALAYVRIRAFEMPFMFVFAAMQAVRQARGDTVTPVILSSLAILVNIVLTALFVGKFGMGVEGAALATMIGQAVICPICLIKLFSKKDELSVRRKDLIWQKKKAGYLTRIALPSATSQAMASLGFLVLQAVILDYGDAVEAAFSIGNKITNLMLVPIMALGAVLAAYVGQNMGAHNAVRAKRAYCVSRNIALLLSVAGVLVLYPLSGGFIALLTNDVQTQILAGGYMFWVLLTQPLMALFQNYIGVFNGSGYTKYSFYMSVARLWCIRLPMILCFKKFTEFGHNGIWYAMVISNMIIVLFGKYLLGKVNYQVSDNQ